MTTARTPAAPDELERGPEDDVQLTLMDHLEELRKRLKFSVLSALGGIVVCYAFAEQIFLWLMEPVFAALPPDQRTLVFTSALEPFFVYMKIGAYAGLFASAPLILVQVWLFISPGLYRRERRFAVPFVALGTLFFVAGALFSRYVVLPYAFEYLVAQFSNAYLKAMLNMQDQLSLVLAMLLAFGVIFELPLILTMLARLGVVSSAFLSKHRRWAVVLNIVLAAVITPTGDPFNLALMAGPLVVCYELGILGARLVERRDRTEETPATA